MKKLLILLAMGITFAGCSTAKSGSGNTNLIELTGKIEKLGMSTFQYGSHTIQANGKTYALKSTKVNLDEYSDKEVILKGTKVAGYPVDNGPELLEVASLKLK